MCDLACFERPKPRKNTVAWTSTAGGDDCQHEELYAPADFLIIPPFLAIMTRRHSFWSNFRKYDISGIVLTRVFEALQHNTLHPHSPIPVPYRDSKLTHLLKPALLSEAKCALISTISLRTNHFRATYRTLKLSAKAGGACLDFRWARLQNLIAGFVGIIKDCTKCKSFRHWIYIVVVLCEFYLRFRTERFGLYCNGSEWLNVKANFNTH